MIGNECAINGHFGEIEVLGWRGGPSKSSYLLGFLCELPQRHMVCGRAPVVGYAKGRVTCGGNGSVRSSGLRTLHAGKRQLHR